MPAQGRGAVDVARRIEIAVEVAAGRGQCIGVRAATDQRSLGSPGADGLRADAEKHEPSLDNRLPLEAHTRGEAREREVAVTARQLLEPPAPPGRRARYRDR